MRYANAECIGKHLEKLMFFLNLAGKMFFKLFNAQSFAKTYNF